MVDIELYTKQARLCALQEQGGLNIPMVRQNSEVDLRCAITHFIVRPHATRPLG